MVDFEVVSLPETEHVGVGETAPDFTRPLVNGEYWENVDLSDLTDEGPVLLGFHSMDGAFPATYFWKEMTARDWTEDVQVVGLSISDPYAHKQLLRERGLVDAPVALFSDPANGVAEAYGIVNHLDGMAGIEEPRPALYLLDDAREVQYVWVAEEWPDFPDYDEAEAAIDRL